MAGTKFTLNHAGMAELLKSEGMRGVIAPYAERILAAAKSSAPVDEGEHRDSGHIEHVTHPTRVVEQVVFDSDHSLAVEADTGHIARSI